MPTSMGMGGTETVGAQTISLCTPSGIYTVLGKANPVVMDSSTFGLPKNSRLGYRETISYTRPASASTASPASAGRHDMGPGAYRYLARMLEHQRGQRQMVLRLSLPGDVVEIRNSGGPLLQLAQNGDWMISWDQWRDGSALKPA